MSAVEVPGRGRGRRADEDIDRTPRGRAREEEGFDPRDRARRMGGITASRIEVELESPLAPIDVLARLTELGLASDVTAVQDDDGGMTRVSFSGRAGPDEVHAVARVLSSPDVQANVKAVTIHSR